MSPDSPAVPLADSVEIDTSKRGADWLNDPEQLYSWQGKLVANCDAINRQLTEIQYELVEEPNGGAIMAFRILSDE